MTAEPPKPNGLVFTKHKCALCHEAFVVVTQSRTTAKAAPSYCERCRHKRRNYGRLSGFGQNHKDAKRKRRPW